MMVMTIFLFVVHFHPILDRKTSPEADIRAVLFSVAVDSIFILDAILRF